MASLWRMPTIWFPKKRRCGDEWRSGDVRPGIKSPGYERKRSPPEGGSFAEGSTPGRGTRRSWRFARRSNLRATRKSSPPNGGLRQASAQADAGLLSGRIYSAAAKDMPRTRQPAILASRASAPSTFGVSGMIQFPAKRKCGHEWDARPGIQSPGYEKGPPPEGGLATGRAGTGAITTSLRDPRHPALAAQTPNSSCKQNRLQPVPTWDSRGLQSPAKGQNWMPSRMLLRKHCPPRDPIPGLRKRAAA